MSETVTSPITAPRAARVTSIRVEYDDGSCDNVELLQVSPIILYGLTRRRPGSLTPRGAYSHGAVAALLFKTAATTLWTEYVLSDTEMAGLVRYWFGESKPNKRSDSEGSQR